MKLKALDQIHVSSVKADSLRPGEEFEVGDALGKELVAKHPQRFAVLEGAAEADGEKAEKPPANKADSRRKTKSA